MSMSLLNAFWNDSEASGGRPKPVYAVFEGDALLYWTLSRRQAIRYAAERDRGRIVRLVPESCKAAAFSP